MFDDALLESSPAQTPVFQSRHWLLALAVGVAGSLAGFLWLPLILPLSGTKMQAIQSVILGIVLMVETLMLCYVFAEAQRLRLRAWIWLCIALGLNLPRFFAFLVRPAMKSGNWKRAAVPAAYMLETVLVSVLILAPLIHTEALGKFDLSTRWVGLPLSPPPPPAPGQGRAPSRSPNPRPLAPRSPLLTTPVILPEIERSQNASAHPNGSGAGITIGVPGGRRDGVPDGIPYVVFTDSETHTPPPPAAASRTQKKLIRVGGQVEAAKIIFQPRLDYPAQAQMTHTQGTVRLEAIIGTDGTIQNLRVLGGHPLLAKAALEAVARWRYQPTLLNGEPVEVITEIQVNFTLSE